jgi:hypothetical protein
VGKSQHHDTAFELGHLGQEATLDGEGAELVPIANNRLLDPVMKKTGSVSNELKNPSSPVLSHPSVVSVAAVASSSR